MSVYLYDEAILNRIRTVLGEDTIHIITPEKVFTKSNNKGDDPIFPGVSLYRPSYSLSTLGKTMSGYRVGRQEYSETLNQIISTRALPISINYQIDVYTRYREQNDELTKELLWFFSLYPLHKLTLTFDDYEKTIEFNVFLGDEITDNSEINEFENKGQYYRSSFYLTVDSAQLFLLSPTDKPKLEVVVKSYDLKGNMLDETILNKTTE